MRAGGRTDGQTDRQTDRRDDDDDDDDDDKLTDEFCLCDVSSVPLAGVSYLSYRVRGNILMLIYKRYNV
jgi:hypothetical protein